MNSCYSWLFSSFKKYFISINSFYFWSLFSDNFKMTDQVPNVISFAGSLKEEEHVYDFQLWNSYFYRWSMQESDAGRIGFAQSFQEFVLVQGFAGHNRSMKNGLWKQFIDKSRSTRTYRNCVKTEECFLVGIWFEIEWIVEFWLRYVTTW